MKREHKAEIREFLYERLFDDNLRWDLAKMCDLAGIDQLEGMEVYEQEAARIRKLFCLDAQ
jgi:hypothetical protein